jgi:hypothetical protein
MTTIKKSIAQETSTSSLILAKKEPKEQKKYWKKIILRKGLMRKYA